MGKRSKLCIVLLILVIFTSSVYADELVENQIYRLDRTFEHIKDYVGAGDFIACRRSKFVVVDNDNQDYYLIRFLNVYDYQEDNKLIESTVKEFYDYRLPRNHPNIFTEKSVSQAFSGPVSGPLVVPFKYRLNNGTITGEATIGYYAGYSFDIPIPKSNFRIPVVPFISGGLTQVSVPTDSGGTNSRSGITIAFGLLIKNWGDLTVGAVVGQDRIGDPDFVHEGQWWLSFMIGWEI